MTETTPQYKAAPSDLAELLTDEQIELLAVLLTNVKRDPGWGAVKIIVIDSRIVNFKLERSYQV